MDAPAIENQANLLVAHIANGLATENLNTVTVAIYDTAWVSMVSKDVDGCISWVFPECFEFLLEQQLPSGGWESYASKDDGILNTLAGLLAMMKHQSRDDDKSLLEGRIQRAVEYLENSLRDWEVESSVHVGFEVLIPTLLKMLEDEGIKFIFPGRKMLLMLNSIKLRLFSPEILYGRTKTTLLHSLEAFIGKIDFDQVRHHKTFGSMMGSPASTAAYLMGTSEWDEEAELYLRKVIREGSGKGNGAVPSVFPIPIFESSWVVSTFLQGGFSVESLGKENLESIASYLEQHYHAQDGLLGFAPSIQADADDTAKTILTLNLLGRPVRAKRMTQNFKSKNGHLHTYLGERDPSFSANCNALRALLAAPDASEYMREMTSLLEFLCDSWWSGSSKDKWNVTPQYPMMLLSEAIIHLLELWDERQVEGFLDTSLKYKISMTLVQIINRTLMTQCSDGSWGLDRSPETTAYAILTLRATSSLPWMAQMKAQITLAIQNGQQFLSECGSTWKSAQYLWVEKVTYGSSSLSEAYCLAAMRTTEASRQWSSVVKDLLQVPEKAVEKISKLFSSLQGFHAEPAWKIEACVLEGLLFVPQLKSARADILPGQKAAKNEYLNFIPCTWVLVNNMQHLFLNAKLLWDMMVLTLCNFRVDEYMETSLTELQKGDVDEVRSIIRELCAGGNGIRDHKPKTQSQDACSKLSNGHRSPSTKPNGNLSEVSDKQHAEKLADVRAVLSPYVEAMLSYPGLLKASSIDRSTLSLELSTFLLSHIDQLQGNECFASQADRTTREATRFHNPRASFFTWAHTTGADSVSCPFSFAFLTCLVASANKNSQGPCFRTATQRYLAKDLCGRLAVMSRLYNDYGSLARDIAEGNVNSVNFPEFYDDLTSQDGDDDNEKATGAQLVRQKKQVLEIAIHERECADMVLAKLLKCLGEEKGADRRRVVRALRLFTGVSELYADIYVARDLSIRVEATS